MKWINDRFTFDNLFRKFLQEKYSREEAKEILTNNYSLSALVFQERIDNKFYKKISLFKESSDLLELKKEIYKASFSTRIDTRNSAINCCQFNFKRNVCSTDESIDSVLQKQFENGKTGILKTHARRQRRRLKSLSSLYENLVNGFTRK